ncbi:F-box protein [Aspergillus affinis]|uniref:F-box protein n=1 Tax=Aspergillus affinis TaxID=1070780 RepID=UPI0022FEBDD7|nr:uncharacterized protein KD926_004847 [Aspergillus affinis]KAI9034992.1 hypothetical protein KD926_004847 [Aspergillus affinis]
METMTEDQPASNGTLKICALPTEIVESIVGFLSSVDVCRLRSSCRAFYGKTLYKFGKTCLSTVNTDLSCRSLQRLWELSQNSAFHHYVRGLRISAAPGRMLGDGFSWNRAPGGALAPPHLQLGAQTLRNALHDLPNCTRFTICLEHPHPDNFDMYRGNHLCSTDAIALILDCVANTGLLVTSFNVVNKAFRSRGTFEMESPRLFFPDLFRQNFLDGWANVRVLRLHHSMKGEDVINWATKIVKSSRDLKKLDIRFGLDNEAGNTIRALAESETLPPIRDLCFSSSSRLGGADLLALLRRFRDSLHTLCLHVDIQSVEWREIITALKDEFPGLCHVNFYRHGCYFLPSVPIISHLETSPFVYRVDQRGLPVNSSFPSMLAALEALLNNPEYFFYGALW